VKPVAAKPIAVKVQTDSTLADVLGRLGAGAEQALAEGRIFIGIRRALALADQVPAGAEVTRYGARAVADAPVTILAQAEGLVAVWKPPEIATIPDHRGRAGTLIARTAVALGIPERELFATSRLDVGVSGVVLFATTEAARKNVADARQAGRYARHYVALCEGTPSPERGLWTATIGRDRDPRKRRPAGRDAVPAETAYAVVAAARGATLLAAEPKTGRTHQIRVHAAHAGAPLLGDRAYGGAPRLVSATGAVVALERIALHAAWIDLAWGGAGRFFAEAPVPDDLRALWSAAGGDGSAWDQAVLKVQR
jgi:23S rRNA-/tRNA-specific pseudouridylate synthase